MAIRFSRPASLLRPVVLVVFFGVLVALTLGARPADAAMTLPPPVVTSPAAGSNVPATFVASGTALPNAWLAFYVNGGYQGFMVQADINGDWTTSPFEITASPGPGGFDLQAEQSNDVDFSPLSAPVHLTSVPPPPPPSGPPPAPTFIKPSSNATLNQYLAVEGGSELGASVTLNVSVGGVVVQTYSFTNVPGFWSINIASPLPISAMGFDLTATQTVPGNPDPSAPATVHVTNIMPPPVITSPVNGEVVGHPFIITGTGVPLAEVIVNVTGQNSEVVLVDLNGQWSVSSSGPLYNPVGGFDIAVGQRARFSPPTGSYTPGATVHVTNWAPAPVITSPTDGTIVPGPSLVVTGTGLPGGSINVFVNLVGGAHTVVAANGTWSTTVLVPSYSPDGFLLNANQWAPADGSQPTYSPLIQLFRPYVAVPCPLGSFSATGNQPCTLAPSGSYVATVGATSASLCPVGTFSYLPGMTSCAPAPLGTYVDVPGSWEPLLCPVGTYSDVIGAASCTQAPAGYFVPTTGAISATAWTVCGPDEYVATPGTSTSDVVCALKVATTTTVSFGPGPFPVTGTAYTATALVSPAAAGTATIVYSGDCVNAGATCTATATYGGNATYLGSSATTSIVITQSLVATTTDQCKQGGWQTRTDQVGNQFKNQGDCVSYVASRGKHQEADSRDSEERGDVRRQGGEDDDGEVHGADQGHHERTKAAAPKRR